MPVDIHQQPDPTSRSQDELVGRPVRLPREPKSPEELIALGAELMADYLDPEVALNDHDVVEFMLELFDNPTATEPMTARWRAGGEGGMLTTGIELLGFPHLSIDERPVLTRLNEFGVRYAVVGGLAVQLHGRERPREDLDLIFIADPENEDLLVKAIQPWHDVNREQFAAVPQGWLRLDNTEPQIDLFPGTHGLDVRAAVSGAEPHEVDGVQVPVVGRDVLIEQKRRSNRSNDQADAEALQPPTQLVRS
jgi:hypothetical protein